MKNKLLAAIVMSLFATVSASAFAMTKVEYKSGKDKIAADYKSAKAACDSLTSNAKDVCIAEAKGNGKVAKADLEARYSGKEKDQNKLKMAKADAAYSVAKEKCNAMSGNDKDVCKKEAKAVEVKAKEDVRLYKTVKSATKESIEDRMNADYKVAIEKCDALTGEAKASCVSNAKVNFKKK